MRFLILVCFLLSGCLGINYTRRLGKEIKYNFINRFEGKNTSISQKISINGYYRYWLNDESGRPEKISNTGDTAYVDMIFYEDGTFIWNLWPSMGYKNYEEYFKSITDKGQDDLFYKSHWWGIYSISNDTIKAQYLMRASPGTPWYTGEEWYRIKNNNSLQVIYFGDFDKGTDKSPHRYDNYVQRAMPVHFMPLEQVPPPLTWLKKEKFFWRYEIDWYTYMKSIGASTH